MKERTSITDQLFAFIFSLGLFAAASLLYAVVVRDCYNWFVVPLAPTVLSPLPFPVAYGLIIAIDAAAMVAYSPKVGDDPDSIEQERHPYTTPLVKTITKVFAFLLLWGIAAIAHAIIAG